MHKVLNLNFARNFLIKPHTGLTSNHHYHHHQHPTSRCHSDLWYTSKQNAEEQHFLTRRSIYYKQDSWQYLQKEKTQRCGKSRMCSDHPRGATPTNVVMWGGVPNVVNHAKCRQNWLRGFDSLKGIHLVFFYAWGYGLWLGLPPSQWL